MIFVIVSTINHRKKLRKESEFIIPLGKLVAVYGHKIHVYEEGSGKKTLVFMSGGGTASPTLDFKSLYSLLSDQYHVVVVEKAGYGFSDVTNTSRDIATILLESALRKYTLVNTDISTFMLHHGSIVNPIHSYVQLMQINDILDTLLDML